MILKEKAHRTFEDWWKNNFYSLGEDYFWVKQIAETAFMQGVFIQNIEESLDSNIKRIRI